MNAPLPPVVTDDYVFLVGRPPISEYISFVQTMAVDGHSIEQGTLAQHWRQASVSVAEIEAAEAGAANDLPLQEVPVDMQPFVARVTADSAFQSTFSNVPTGFFLVEIDRLVVFQKFINLGFVQELKDSLSATPGSADIARLAFGLDRPQPGVTIRQAGNGVFQFVSASSDIRPLEATLIEPTKVLDFKTSGRIQAFVGMSVGFGTNVLNALQVEGRLVLHNGSHRAYALRALGVTHAPCIVQQVTSRDELDFVGSGDIQQNPDCYLKVSRPSMLRDYFDPQLTRVFPVARKNRMVQVQVSASVTEIPGA